MRDITELMNTYRECSRNLWNVYFSRKENIGGSLDAFEQIRELLFDSLVVSELSYEGDAEGDNIPPPVLRVVPRERTLILIQRLSGPREATYWDHEKDMVVGPDDITPAFSGLRSAKYSEGFQKRVGNSSKSLRLLDELHGGCTDRSNQPKAVPGVRIPPSPPELTKSFQRRVLRVAVRRIIYITRVPEPAIGCTLVAHMFSSVLMAAAASLLTVLT
jgi:hypothetical protein